MALDRITIFFALIAAATMPWLILFDRMQEIRQYNILLAGQMGPFTIRGSHCRRRDVRSACVLLIVAGCCAMYDRWTRVFIPAVMWGLCMACYILYKERTIYKEICRRTSILFLLLRFPHLTDHNAEQFCKDFHLDVFPLQTFERLCLQNPQATLFDLKKFVNTAQWHANTIADFKDTNKHLLCIENAFKVAHC